MFKSSSAKAQKSAAKAIAIDAAIAASTAAAEAESKAAAEAAAKAAAIAAKKASAKIARDKKFYRNCLKLVEYEQKNGNMKVPTKKHELSIFVSEVRRTGRQLIQGLGQGSIKLDKQKIQLLDFIGFDWGSVNPKKFPEEHMP